MRVLTVYYEHRPGGMMKMIYRMLLAGAERGWQMSYLAVSPYRIEHENLRPSLLPAPRNHSSLFFWAWFLALAPFATLWLAWRRRSEMLAMFEGVYACVALPAKRILGLPMVVFLQSDVATINAMHGRASLLRRIEQWMEGAGLRNADRIIATNKTLADLVRQRWNLPPERLVVIPNNVAQPPRASADAQARLRRELDVPEGAFLIATSGVFAPRKNLRLLLGAFAGVRSAGAHLVVIGEGTEPGRWRALVDETRNAPNGERVHFVGWRGDVVDLLAGCDLFVFPTRHEGSPLSLIEALRVGLACLGSDIPEIREVLGDDPACLFGVDDAARLRASIEGAASDPRALEHLRAIAAERAAIYDFDWDTDVTTQLERAAAREPGVATEPSAKRRRPSQMLVHLFEKATGSRAAPRTATAVARFGPYMVGMIVAKAFSTVGQLLVSRWLGPSEFGHLAVVLSTSTLVALPLAGAWGTTFVRYAAGQPESTWAPLLRWTSRRALRGTAIIALGVALLSPLLAPALHVSAALLLAGAGLGVAMALWLVAKSASQGRESWRGFVASELAFGAVVVALQCGLIALGAAQWWQAALVFGAAYVAGSVPAWSLLRPVDAPAAGEAAWWRTAGGPAEFVRFALVAGVANTILLNSDRFAVQHVLGFEEVGIYQVYNFGTLGVAALFSTMLYNFVVPLFPQGDRRAFAALFRTGFARLLPLILATLFLAGWAQIYLTRFPFRPALLALATLSAGSFITAGFYGHLVASLGVNGVQLGSKVSVATVILFAVGVVPAVRLGGLDGLFALYTVLYLGIAVFYDQALRHLSSEASPSSQASPSSVSRAAEPRP